MSDNWDAGAFKALLRTTSQRLGQLQERNDSQGQLTRREIAAHLAQGQLAPARAKAATLIQEDAMGDLLEELEMLVGVVGSHVGELGPGGVVGSRPHGGVSGKANGEVEDGGSSGRTSKLARLSPALVEAAASIIHAAPSTESKDLNAVREVLIQRLGSAFTQTVSSSRNNHVSSRIIQIMSSPLPTALKMDTYLTNIAQTHGVKWAPEPRREDLLDVISEILRVDTGSSPIVDLPRLRQICARGLPDDPPWVRPRIWRLLFGTLPVLKTTWAKENRKQRESYYDLVRRLLAPLSSLPPPTDPLSSTDANLVQISDSLFCVSSDMFVLLGNEPKSTFSGKCPLDHAAPDDIRISCASDLDKRLIILKGDGDAGETPEIRLETDLNGSDLTPQSPPGATAVASRHQRRPTTLLPSKAYSTPPAHRAHLSALLRLLYIHRTLNPAVQSPHVPWLLVPLYSAIVGETDEDDAAHVEADTFWVFEALVGEIAEMEEEEGGKIWTRKLSERVRWADGALATSLHATGLDPVLPHYSYHWLAPLLTQTLPLSSVFPVWDVLFACPMRARDHNPKLEHLVDICTALLVRARTPLFRLGKGGRNVPGLWSQEHSELPPLSPLRPWELSDAFTEGKALLLSYPIDAAGGIDRILQTASDLTQKRTETTDKKERERGNAGFGARIRQQMWKGFTNQLAEGSPEEEEEEEQEEQEGVDEETLDHEHDDGNETETPAAPTLTSRLANTVWRGITNQSSMEDESPSPPSPLSARGSPTPPDEHDTKTSAPSSQASLWGYAGKLKDSDTVAAFSKVSANWRAIALDAFRTRKESNASMLSKPEPPAQSTPPSATSEHGPRHSGWPSSSSIDVPRHRGGSLPGTRHENDHPSLDPPRPAVFHSPRESFLPQPRRQHATASSSPNVDSPRDSDTESNVSFIHRAGASIASLATYPSSHSTQRSVPRPLMLNARDLITSKSPSPQPLPPSRSEGETPAGQWGDVLLAAKNRHALRQASVSSVSSLSNSEAITKSSHPFPGAYTRSAGTGPRSDYESDGSAAKTSRKVPLNRKSVSPMALASRSPNLPWNASSPVAGRSTGHPLSNGSTTAEEVETPSGLVSQHCEEQFHLSASTATSAMTGTTGFDSPTTIGSPPIPRTPLMPAVSSVVRIVNGGDAGGGGHAATSSISTLSEASEINIAPLEPPTQARLLAHKKTPPFPALPGTPDQGDLGELMTSSESEAVEMMTEITPVGKAPAKLRSKRYAPRPGNLRLRSPGSVQGTSDQRTPSPGQRSLAPEWPGEHDLATTPKMGCYPGEIGEDEEGLEEGHDVVVSRPSCTRKPSKEARLKRIPSAGTRDGRRVRDSSGAEEGDDEGYDELLSAYESEEGSRE